MALGQHQSPNLAGGFPCQLLCLAGGVSWGGEACLWGLLSLQLGPTLALTCSRTYLL